MSQTSPGGGPLTQVVYFSRIISDQFYRIGDKRAERGEIILVSSVLTLTEVLTLPFSKGAEDLARSYTDLLLGARYLQLEPIGPAIAEQAARLRALYRLRTPDAIQLAVAQQTGCEAFLTNDSRLSRVESPSVLLVSDLQP